MQITFLEVDEEDTASIHEKHPDAGVYPGPIAEHFDDCAESEIICHFLYSRFDSETLDRLPKLKLLVTRTVGFNHIDLDACNERGITVCNVPDYGSHVIAEHVFALLLGTLRHIHEADKRIEAGEFDYHGLRGIALKGKTIGIVGTGSIGSGVATIAHGFGMKLIATDMCRNIALQETLGLEYLELDDLLTQSDIISLHLPANEHTRHIIDADAFEKMKKGVIVVNTARGELVDSQALLQALKNGTVAHALLDVLEDEKNIEKNREIIDHPAVVTTPHIAFYADDSMHNMYADAFDSIDEFLAGKAPKHTVQQEKLVCDMPKLGK